MLEYDGHKSKVKVALTPQTTIQLNIKIIIIIVAVEAVAIEQ